MSSVFQTGVVKETSSSHPLLEFDWHLDRKSRVLEILIGNKNIFKHNTWQPPTWRKQQACTETTGGQTEKMSPRREKKTWSDSGLRGKSGVTGKGRFYLRKRAVSEEAEQPETLTGDSLTDLRRDRRTWEGGYTQGCRSWVWWERKGSGDETRMGCKDRRNGFKGKEMSQVK